MINSCLTAPGHPREDHNSFASTIITRFPFTLLSGGIIIVQVQLAEFTDSLNFILDTGSGGISLDSTTVDRYKLPITPSNRMLRGIGSLRKINYVHDKTLHLPKLDVEHLDFHINDYSLLSSVYGLKIDGIIGFSLLNRYIVKINYDLTQLEIWSPGVIKLPKSGYCINPVLNGIPIFEANIQEEKLTHSRFYFDTGAGLCLLMSEAFAKDSSIFPTTRKMTITQAEGLSGKEPMRLTVVKQLKIGPYKFKKVPTHIFHDEYNVTAYPMLGGLIGNDLLRRFNLIINYGQNQIHLKPNTHFKEPFDYSYTGLGIYAEGGQIVIEDVLEGSPGEEAGIKAGDVLIAVNNNTSGNIQAYKTLLQHPKTKVKMIVSRGGTLIMVTLRVASIL